MLSKIASKASKIKFRMMPVSITIAALIYYYKGDYDRALDRL